jgi:hypothetical protein
MRKITILLSLIIAIGFTTKAQTYLLQEDFSSITTGDNTTTSGSGTVWTGNTNFPTVSTVYQAGGAVKVGKSAGPGSITSKSLDLSVNSGTFTISLDVKGWTTVEGTLTVTVTGLAPQTVTYAATAASAFEHHLLEFTGGTANSTITIATSAKRAYIDNVNVYYTVSCNPSNIAFATSSITKTVADVPFTQTATSLNTTAPITYSSSASGVATVNATSGQVAIVGVGSTTITASQIAADGYCAASASYTLTVTALPTLTVTDITDTSLSTEIGKSVTQILNISAVNLSADLGLAITGVNSNLFTLSQYSITQNGGNVPNTSLTITYTPNAVGSHTATLTMASTGAMDLTRSISGTATLATNLNNLKSDLNVFVENQNIKFTTEAGKSIEIYNAVGQKLVQKQAVDGLNSIQISTKGVLFVKVDNQIAKVIL